MALLANLTVGLTAETGAFSRKLKTAAKDADKFIASVSKTFISGAGKIAGEAAKVAAIAVVAAGAGVALAVKRQFAAVDAIAKTSDKLGIATEALTGLRYSAELSGAQVQDLDKGLEEMAKSVAEASRGMGVAKLDFAAMGLSAKDLARLAPEEQFYLIADAFKHLGSQSERVKVSLDVFKGSGAALVNTLALGSDQLKENASAAVALGAAFSRVDAAKVEIANDAVTRLKLALTGLVTKITFELAPLVGLVADKLTAYIVGSETLARVGDNLFDSMATLFSYILDGLDSARRLMQDLTAKLLEGVGTALGNLADIQVKDGVYGKARIGDLTGLDSVALGIGNAGARMRIARMKEDGAIQKGTQATLGQRFFNGAQQVRLDSEGAATIIAKKIRLGRERETRVQGISDAIKDGFQVALPKLFSAAASVFPTFFGTTANEVAEANDSLIAKVATTGTFGTENVGRTTADTELGKVNSELRKQTTYLGQISRFVEIGGGLAP